MLRSGQFDNLKWGTLAEDHAANWDRLRDEFGLPLGQIPPSASLDELATMSIQAFRKNLFTNTLTKQGTEEGASYAEDMEGWLTPAIRDHLTVTFAYRFLVDNLTILKQPECIRAVFDCRAESNQRYKFGVLDEQGQPVRDTDAERELKDNYCRSRRRSCGKYDGKIKRVLDFHKDLLRAGYEDALEYDAVMSEEEQRQEAKALKEKRKQMAPFHVVGPPRIDRTAKVNADLALIDRENAARVAERYAAPNWIYSLAMACSWTGSPLAVKNRTVVFLRDFDKTSLAFGLAQFLGNQEWGPLLFQTEEKSWRPFMFQTEEESWQPFMLQTEEKSWQPFMAQKRGSPWQSTYLPFVPVDEWVKQTKAAVESWQSQVTPAAELRIDQNGCAFVAIPYVKSGTYKCDLPPKSYIVEGSTSTFELTAEIQRVLNCYLVERSFHGYASATALECIRARQGCGRFEIHRDQYLQLPTVARLRAPLVHPLLIRFLDNVIAQSKPGQPVITWAEEVIFDWNAVILPLLEEYFIRAVWARYEAEGVDGVLKAITAAFMKSDGSCRRCDWLDLYRLVEVESLPEEAPKELRHDPIANQVFANAYLAGLGITTAPEQAMRVDLEHAAVFDDLNAGD